MKLKTYGGVMLKNIIKVLKIAGVYIGIIIGAGFASGREITSFFIRYGEMWIWGIVLTGLLFALLGYAVLDIIYEKKITTYKEFMTVTMGNTMGSIMEWISGIFLCVLFFTMVAASGAVAKEAFGANYYIGVFLMLSACFIVFLFDVKGVVAVNGLLSPFLIISGILIGVYTYYSQTKGVFLEETNIISNSGWIFSAILYVSYNIITAISVLVSVNAMITEKKIAFWSGIIGGVAMGLLGACIGGVIYINYNTVKNLELPMFAIINNYGGLIRFMYTLMLLAAIFTTAVGNGFGAIKWIEGKTNMSGIIIKILFIIVSAGASFIGFSGFVGRFYPLFGYLGLIEMGVIAYWCLNGKLKLYK